MLPIRGCHPLWRSFPAASGHILGSAGPRSLAATNGVSVDFLSSGYLDVSVPRVRPFNPMCSGQKYLSYLIIDTRKGNNNQISGGLPHSEILGSKVILTSPKLIAEYHVLHRLLLPRHPPNALIALDLTQKEQGPFRSKACTFPAPIRADRDFRTATHASDSPLVSVLDLDSIVSCIRKARRPASANAPPLGHINTKLMCYLSKRCQFI